MRKRLVCILIDLRLPTFRGGGAKRRVSLAEHMPADEKRSKGLGNIILPGEFLATPPQLSVGTFNPTSRLGQKANVLERR